VDLLILVTLGTNDKAFVRLLEEVDKLIGEGVITDEVVVQAGFTKYHSPNMKILDLVPILELEDLTHRCDLLITHGGVGSIITGLKNGKKVIAVPRLAQYKEHVNNHQLEIIENFHQSGYLIGIGGTEELKSALLQVKNFSPKPYQSNTENMLALVKKCIEE